MLINLAKETFRAAGWPTRVLTGRYMFDLANNTRSTANVDHDMAPDPQDLDTVQHGRAKPLKI